MIKTNIAELLRKTVIERKECDAITYQGRTLTWIEVFELSLSLSNKIKKLGINQNDTIAIYAPHSTSQVIAIFGIALADCNFTIINIKLKPDQVKYQISDANVKMLIGEINLIENLQEFWRQRSINIIEINNYGEIKNLKYNIKSNYNLHNKATKNIYTDISNIIYTSGSTGRAKGIVVPHKTLIEGAEIVSEYLKISQNDITLSFLPFNFDYGLNQLMTAVLKGCQLIIENYISPQELFKTIYKYKITGFAAVPAIWPKVINEMVLKNNNQKYISSLRYITTAGGIHTKDTVDGLSRIFKNKDIYIMYGLSESFRSTYLCPSEFTKRIGSIGKPVQGVDIKIVDKNGSECENGEKGELIHRGAFVTYGYLNNVTLTKEKFIRLNTGGDGCIPEMAVRSGDLVSKDSEGFIYFHGRLDMQIKYNGYRISPEEIEEAAISYIKISRVAVFGLNSNEVGEEVNMAIETHNNIDINISKFKQFLKRLLPSYCVPMNIRKYKKLPINTTGKIDYQKIKTDFKLNVRIK